MVEVPAAVPPLPVAAGSGQRSWAAALIVGTMVFVTIVLVPYVQPRTLRSPLHHLRAVGLHQAPGEDGGASSNGAGGSAQPADDSGSGAAPGRAHPPLPAPRQPEQRQQQEQREEQEQQEPKQPQKQLNKQQQETQEPPPPPQPQQQHPLPPPPQRPQPLSQLPPQLPPPPPPQEQQQAATQEAKSPKVQMQPIVEPLEEPEVLQEPETPPAVASSAEDWKEGMAFHAPQSGCTVQPNGELRPLVCWWGG